MRGTLGIISSADCEGRFVAALVRNGAVEPAEPQALDDLL